jgi:hypothetical protein
MAKYSSALRLRGGSLALLLLSLVLCFSGCPNPTTQTPAVQDKETVKTPSFSPAAGSYSSAQSVSIATSTSGASIYYTTDGSTPSASSTKYATPIAVGSSQTLKAIALKEGMNDSAVASAAYVIGSPLGTVATPVLDPAEKTFSSFLQVNISCATAGARIYYTTDGSAPDASSSEYLSPVTVTKTLAIKAIAIKDGMNNSAVATGSYTHNANMVATPSFLVSEDQNASGAGSYSSSITVQILCSTSGAAIYYTTDGAAPTASSNLYSSPLAISSSTTLKAIAIKENMANSEVGSASYTIDASKVSTPVMTPAAGTYTQDCPVSIACATTDATIYYTTDGSDPSTASASYSTPFELKGDVTAAKTFVVKAIAVKEGMKASDVVSGTYIIQYPILSVPQADPGSGSTIKSGSRIYLSQSDYQATTLTYTTDGSDPTTSSTAKNVGLTYSYPSPKLVISAAKPASGNILVIKAFASGPGYRNSGVAAFSYTVDDTADTGIIGVELK